MFQAFRLSNIKFNEPYKTQWTQSGKDRNAVNASKVRGSLEKFIDAGEINGSQLRDDWFPTINADVFISHSREDRDVAFALSGWLKDVFGIESFIDSCVWGYSDDLLRQLDDKFCWQESSQTYNYQKRNGTTSHVHMMLATALAKMMDHIECTIFVSSPTSVSAKDSIETVSSPWIYFELTMISLLRRRRLDDYRIVKEARAYEFSSKTERLPIFYEASFDSLTSLSADTLNTWEDNWRKSSSKQDFPLDSLYELVA